MKTLTIRVSDEEHQLMQAVAARRFMSITGITRAHFHALAEKDGLLKPAEPPAPKSMPAPAPAPKPVPKSPYTPMEYPNPFADLPPVDDLLFDNPPPDDML